MALPDVCFSSTQGMCNCTSPPPTLPSRPNFGVDPTTTGPPTNHTTDPTTTATVTTTNTTGLIVGCTCGVVIFILLIGFLIWCLWKNGICCFRRRGDGEQNGSQAILPVHEDKQVELVKIEKKGTVILTPTTKPQVWQEGDGPPPGPPSGPPVPNTAPDLTPVERSKEAEVSPSPTTAGRPDSSTSKEKKKKKKKESKSNRVSPEPIPKPEKMNP